MVSTNLGKNYTIKQHGEALQTRAKLAERIESNLERLKLRNDHLNRIDTSPSKLTDDPVYSQIKDIRRYFQNFEEREPIVDPFPILTIIRLQLESRTMKKDTYSTLCDSNVKENAKKIIDKDFRKVLLS